MTRRQCRTQVSLGRSCMKLQCFGKKLQTSVTQSQFSGLHSARTQFYHKWQCPRLRNGHSGIRRHASSTRIAVASYWQMDEYRRRWIFNLHVYVSSPFKQSTPRFWMVDENTAISTPRQNSSRAEGTTKLTRRFPSASNLTHTCNMLTNNTKIDMKWGYGIWFVCKVNKVHFYKSKCQKESTILPISSWAALRAKGSPLWSCLLPWSFALHHFPLLPLSAGSPKWWQPVSHATSCCRRTLGDCAAQVQDRLWSKHVRMMNLNTILVKTWYPRLPAQVLFQDYHLAAIWINEIQSVCPYPHNIFYHLLSNPPLLVWPKARDSKTKKWGS